MTVENDFLPFAAGAGSNVLTQAQYAALAAVSTGFAAGTASSAAANKAWRQSSLIASVIAQFIVAQSGQPAIDDGTTATLLANFELALQAVSAAAANAVIGDARNASMSVAAASTTATFTADEIVVGSALGGTTHKIGAFSQSINLASNGAGGMDTGAAPVSGYIALYAIYNPATNTAALLATNATSAVAPSVYGGANMPAGYTASALISVWPTNASGQFVVGAQRDRTINTTATSALSTSTTQASLTSLSIASAVPLNAKAYTGTCQAGSTTTSNVTFYIAASASGIGQKEGIGSTVTGSTIGANISGPILTPQTLFYTFSSTAGTPSATILISSYII